MSATVASETLRDPVLAALIRQYGLLVAPDTTGDAALKFANEELQLRRRLIGSLLKAARERVGMTQQGVATKLSYSSPQFVSNWERGLAMPPMDILPQLSKTLAISPRELIEALCEYQDELLKIQKERLRTVFRKKFPEVR